LGLEALAEAEAALMLAEADAKRQDFFGLHLLIFRLTLYDL
jgi:hypothetical protein